MSKLISDEEIKSAYLKKENITMRPENLVVSPMGRAAIEAQALSSDREWVEAGDELLTSLYWSDKFSTPAIRKFWKQLKQKVREK